MFNNAGNQRASDWISPEKHDLHTVLLTSILRSNDIPYEMERWNRMFPMKPSHHLLFQGKSVPNAGGRPWCPFFMDEQVWMLRYAYNSWYDSCQEFNINVSRDYVPIIPWTHWTLRNDDAIDMSTVLSRIHNLCNVFSVQAVEAHWEWEILHGFHSSVILQFYYDKYSADYFNRSVDEVFQKHRKWLGSEGIYDAYITRLGRLGVLDRSFDGKPVRSCNNTKIDSHEPLFGLMSDFVRISDKNWKQFAGGTYELSKYRTAATFQYEQYLYWNLHELLNENRKRVCREGNKVIIFGLTDNYQTSGIGHDVWANLWSRCYPEIQDSILPLQKYFRRIRSSEYMYCIENCPGSDMMNPYIERFEREQQDDHTDVLVVDDAGVGEGFIKCINDPESARKLVTGDYGDDESDMCSTVGSLSVGEWTPDEYLEWQCHENLANSSLAETGSNYSWRIVRLAEHWDRHNQVNPLGYHMGTCSKHGVLNEWKMRVDTLISQIMRLNGPRLEYNLKRDRDYLMGKLEFESFLCSDAAKNAINHTFGTRRNRSDNCLMCIEEEGIKTVMIQCRETSDQAPKTAKHYPLVFFRHLWELGKKGCSFMAAKCSSVIWELLLDRCGGLIYEANVERKINMADWPLMPTNNLTHPFYDMVWRSMSSLELRLYTGSRKDKTKEGLSIMMRRDLRKLSDDLGVEPSQKKRCRHRGERATRQKERQEVEDAKRKLLNSEESVRSLASTLRTPNPSSAPSRLSMHVFNHDRVMLI